MHPSDSSQVEYLELQPYIVPDALENGRKSTSETSNDYQETSSEITSTILHASHESASILLEDEHKLVSDVIGNDQGKNWPSRPKLHWAVPSTMVGSFLMAAVLAAGHHIFYRHYDCARLDLSLDQQWTNTIGTAFAFLVKVFAAIAASTAYVQRQWLVLRARPFKISDVDSLSGVLRDPTVFAEFKL